MSLRVAYIGCGAVTERSHLPALQSVTGMQATVLIDANLAQAKRVAQQYGITHCGESIEDFHDAFDCAVIATPSGSHAALGQQILKANKHVLIEKPLAINMTQAVPLLELSKQSETLLAVGLIRRLLPHYQLFKSLLQQNIIGSLVSFELEEGAIFNWPVQSASFYKPEQSGGGVLMDTGAHVLDACLWWFGDYQTIQYADDSLGGVEADCELTLAMSNGVSGVVRLSRLRQLSNQVTAQGENGNITMNLLSGDISLSVNGTPLLLNGVAQLPKIHTVGQHQVNSTLDLFIAQYINLRDAINNSHTDALNNLVMADEAIKSVQLIDTCYQQRQPLVSCEW